MGRKLDRLIAALAADLADVKSAVDEVVAELKHEESFATVDLRLAPH